VEMKVETKFIIELNRQEIKYLLEFLENKTKEDFKNLGIKSEDGINFLISLFTKLNNESWKGE